MSKLIFFGTPEFALPILKKIYESKNEIISVITKPPNRSKRGQRVQISPVHDFAKKKNLFIKTPDKIENEENFFKGLEFDLGIVVAYGQIIPEKILKYGKFGFINVHASILPKYRGAAPIQRSIINLDKISGVSIMKINKGLDAGPVCNTYKVQINEKDNYTSLATKLSNIAAKNINQNINLIVSNKIKFFDQDHKISTYAKKINKCEGKINWSDNAKYIEAKIRALYPSPGVWFNFDNERYKILKAKLSSKSGKPGLVLDDRLTIGCGINSLEILDLQRQGKKPQKKIEFLLGSKIKKGIILNNG